MKKILKRVVISSMLIAALMISSMPTVVVTAAPKLSDTSLSMKTGQSKTLKVSSVGSAKITWKSSNKKVAMVSTKGKVTAVAAGKAIISAKVSGTTLKCRVKVSASYTRETLVSKIKKYMKSNTDTTYYDEEYEMRVSYDHSAGTYTFTMNNEFDDGSTSITCKEDFTGDMVINGTIGNGMYTEMLGLSDVLYVYSGTVMIGSKASTGKFEISSDNPNDILDEFYAKSVKAGTIYSGLYNMIKCFVESKKILGSEVYDEGWKDCFEKKLGFLSYNEFTR